MERKTILRHAGLLIKLALGIGLIIFLMARTDIRAFLKVLREVDISLFFIALLVSALTLFVRSYKWHLLLRIQGARLSLHRLHAIVYMALFFNNFFPGSLGGEAFKVYSTMKYPDSKGGAVSSVLMEKITGLPVLFLIILIAAVGSLFSDEPVVMQGQLYTIIALSALILSVFFITSVYFSRLDNLRVFKGSGKVAKVMENFIQSIIIHKNHKKTLIACLILSSTFYLINSVAMYFFALSANENINILHFAFIVPLVSVIVMLPVSANGIGLQEGAFYFYFQKIGVDSSSALLIALLPRAGMLLFSLIGAVLYLIEGKKTL